MSAQPHADAHAVADAFGVPGHQCRGLGIQYLARRFPPQGEPALEVFDADGQRLVFRQRVAAIVSAAQRHRGPERRHQDLVRVPVIDPWIEGGPEQRVGAYLVVKAVDQRGES